MRAIAKTNFSVARNNKYQRGSFSIRERHNERKNEEYANPDIIREQSHLNIHFKQCAEPTYEQTFNKMVDDEVISTRGLRQDAVLFCEFVFDVNTAYFVNQGGYEYAKKFFEEAYRFAIAEAGGEQYILSAVMHADERNKGLSEALGYDVYHYHLHVVYVPVVEKEIRWSKRCKDKELVGKVKKVIHQVSDSKKWEFPKALDKNGNVILNKNGNPIRIPSYSLLQDRFYLHMKNAGYEGFERGKQGSTRVHLDTLDFKIQEDTKRLQQIEQQVEQQQRELQKLTYLCRHHYSF